RWILRQIMAQEGQWIIVLDGFGQAGLNPEVRLTIEALASMIPKGQFRKRVRMVLLDYPHTLPSVTASDFLEEVLPPAATVRREDLEPCIRDWDAKRRTEGRSGLPAAELLDLAQGMIERAPLDGKARLESLNQDLVKLLELP